MVAIDEAQFFDWDVAEVARLLADRGLRVIITGLDLDFRGEPFGPMPLLMAEAEMVDKLHAICVVCAAPACRTQRLINGQPARYTDPVILVGADDVYEARAAGIATKFRGGRTRWSVEASRPAKPTFETPRHPTFRAHIEQMRLLLQLEAHCDSCGDTDLPRRERAIHLHARIP